MNPRRLAFIKEYAGFRVYVPEGWHMFVEVKRQTVDKRSAMVATTMGMVTQSGRFMSPGTYTVLLDYSNGGYPDDPVVMMSDHLCEVADHADLVYYARDHAPLKHVLINGLGLGVALVLLAPYVERFTVVELSRSVIKLVEPHYKAMLGDRLRVIHANALDYQPPKGMRYDAVFHDIWYGIDEANLEEMKVLHRKYGRFTNWQQSWARNYCESLRRKKKRNPEAYKDAVSISEVMKAINTLFAIADGEADGNG